MTVRVNKPEFNIREKLSELERPIGLKGSELMRAETAQEARDLVSAGRKNIIINGDMRIAQRGTTTTIDNNYGCVDRWFKYSSGDTSTWGQATDPVHGTYAYWEANSSGYGNLRQRIEPFFVPTEGINFTASFWMKISSGTAPLRYEIWNLTDNSQIESDMNYDTLTTEWKKYTINFRLDSGDSMDNWHLMLGSNSAPANVTFYLTKCQIERGDIATEFEHRSYGEELALCQRYYETTYPTGYSEGHNFNQSYPFATSHPIAFNFIASDDNISAQSYTFQVSKRANPTVRLFSANNGNSNQALTYKGTGGTNSNHGISVVNTSPTHVLISTILGAVNESNESYFHIVAESEL